MKREEFSRTSRYLTSEYLKVDPQVLATAFERLLHTEEELTGEFLLIGENDCLPPPGTESYLTIAEILSWAQIRTTSTDCGMI